MRFFIDGRELDTDRNESVSISISVEQFTKLGESTWNEVKYPVKIPVTERNRQVVGDAEEIASGVFFNQQEHEGWIEADGCRLIEGPLRLCGVEHGPESEWYRFEIVTPGNWWAQRASEEMFRMLEIDFREVFNGEMIQNSWTWDQPVRFLPVQRQEFLTENPEENMIEPVRVLTVEDYHPFLHVRSLLEKMMEVAGYRISSDFFQSEYFDSLYISGNYIVHDVELLRSRMDFLAGRFYDTEAETDRFGYVYTGEAPALNCLGLLVDTADPEAVSDEGTTIEGVFNVNGCFRAENGGVAFYPPQEVVLGFEYHFIYTTETWMASREELWGINRVKLPGEEFREFRIANRNKDRREEYTENFSYLLIVFDYVEGEQFRMTHDVVSDPEADLNNLQPGEYETEVAIEFAARSCTVGAYTNNRLTHPKLWIASGETYIPYEGDWALYDGYVSERGSVDVEFTVYSTPERLLPSQPKHFERVVFAGPKQGMKMVLRKYTRLKPRFTAHPGEGSVLIYEEIAEHRVRQIRMIEAVQHLFNLCFYTDHRTRTVYIEPKSEFYCNDVVVDWSEKVDRSRSVEIAEVGEEMCQTMTYCYQEGDGAVDQWNEEHGELLGSWSVQVKNRFAQRGEKIEENSMATASIVKDDVYAEAPSAGLLQTGNRAGMDDDANVNFPAKFVHYFGMKPLPEGELWGWPGGGKIYPDVAVHRPASEGKEEVSLLFEDRDGVVGLHRFRDIDFKRCDLGRKVTVWLFLEPRDVEALLVPNRLKRDFRALFRLGIGGEDGLFRLESVEKYRPGDGSTRCVFFREV